METKADRNGASPLPWLEVCALLAVAQVAWAGYRFGIGNQSIQVPFLKHLVDPSLYAHDYLLASLRSYPTLFFRALATLLPSPAWVEAVYPALHLVTAWAVLAAAFSLARALARRDAAGFAAVVLLLAGHHAALAESNLYSAAFTHTWVALPFALAALALSFRGRAVAAFAVAGLLFNVHALTAAYTAVLLGAGLLAGERPPGARRLATAAAAFLLPAAPTLVLVLRAPGGFDAAWLRLLFIRSAHHVDPAAWWSHGRAQVPRFATLLAFAALAATAAPLPAGRGRRLLAMFTAAAALWAVGSAAAWLLPAPLLLRAQLFRSSLLPAFLALILVAHAATALARGSALARPARRAAALAAAAGLLAVFALPGLAPLLPWVLAAASLAALAAGRLHPLAAAATGAACLVSVVAWRTTGFPLFAGPAGLAAALGRAAWPVGPSGRAALLAGAGAAAALAGARLARRPAARVAVRAGALAVFAAALALLRPVLFEPDAAAWSEVQRAARRLAPRGAVLLVPRVPGGFRVHAERAVAGEWRDGTQQFFDPDVAAAWWSRMEALQPGMRYDAAGRRLLERGTKLAGLDAKTQLALAARLGATHLVLPADAPRPFRRLYANADWVLYEAGRPPLPPVAPNVRDLLSWAEDERFLRDVVQPNIERYRKSGAELRVVDGAGRPMAGVRCELRQIDSAFLFGSALPYFEEPAARAPGFRASIVTPNELDRFLELFNFTLPGYSGKWVVMEPREGEPAWAEFDRYVDWCTRHGVAVEFHFVSGYVPAWAKRRGREETARLFVRRAEQLAERYGDRIRFWQVVNEKILLQDAPAVIRRLRELQPDAGLGISDCARFWSPQRDGPRRERDLMRGLREVRWLREQGTPVDFFGFHGHRPFGLWAGAGAVYEAFDAFAREGVRLHVSELGVKDAGPVEGDLRDGTWNRDLQAEYYRRIYTVCFSHPAVDAINIWGMGPGEWIRGAGLLDGRGEPKPAFFALRDLVRNRWRTRTSLVTGRDGRAAFRGFHGRYRLALSRPGGGAATGELSVRAGGPNAWSVAWDEAAGRVDAERVR